MPAIGAVLHTINIRLPREQLVYIINHADDRLIFLDKSVAVPDRRDAARASSSLGYVLMDDRGPEPASIPAPSHDYEELLADAPSKPDFPTR